MCTAGSVSMRDWGVASGRICITKVLAREGLLLVSKVVVATKKLEKAGFRCVALKAAVVGHGHSQVIYLD
jgi:hypothetical protein